MHNLQICSTACSVAPLRWRW